MSIKIQTIGGSEVEIPVAEITLVAPIEGGEGGYQDGARSRVEAYSQTDKAMSVYLTPTTPDDIWSLVEKHRNAG